MTEPTTVAIIGLGSRGLSVLERIATRSSRAGQPPRPVQVELIDPRCDGAGAHPTDQPDYLLLNTTCSQVTMFPDEHSVGDQVAPGPTLYDWVTERDMRLADDGYTVGGTGRPIRPTDFLPRRLLGEYLGWSFAEIRRRISAQIRLRTHRAEAVDLAAGPDHRLLVTLSDGTVLAVQYAFLTTGHTPNRRPGSEPAARPRTISSPYPLPEQLAQVRPGESVVIGGFGLSAMDLMSCLTVGRGGRFIHTGDQCRYLPSGREPTMLFYSRSGVPFRARPLVTQYGPAYAPVVFTTGAIEALRARTGRLDLDRDVLPLLMTEMRIAYRRCEAALAGPDAARSLGRELAGVSGFAGVTAVLDRLDARLGRFDPYALFEGSGGMLLDDATGYQKWLAEAVKSDLAEGVLGFTRSLVKAALDVLRALRDTIRNTVDFGGLTAPSRDAFFRRIVPLLNRAVVGPQFERHSELLALLMMGIAEAPFGPAPELTWQDRAGRWAVSSSQLAIPYRREVDWVCAGTVAFPAVGGSASRLLTGLHREGWIRPHGAAGSYLPGIDVDRDQHPVNRHGKPERRIWVLGPLCEGTTYYNNALPWTGSFSRPAYDAHRCVDALLTDQS
jgi:uncharacterized NAD(P)/FAD-binding protein YdhS